MNRVPTAAACIARSPGALEIAGDRGFGSHEKNNLKTIEFGKTFGGIALFLSFILI